MHAWCNLPGQASAAAHQVHSKTLQCDMLQPSSWLVMVPRHTPPASTTVLAEQLALQGTILPGVTRKSVIQLLQAAGYQVEETNVTVSEAMEADEVFTTGTAVVVCAVGSLTYKVGLGGSMLPCCSADCHIIYQRSCCAPTCCDAAHPIAPGIACKARCDCISSTIPSSGLLPHFKIMYFSAIRCCLP